MMRIFTSIFFFLINFIVIAQVSNSDEKKVDKIFEQAKIAYQKDLSGKALKLIDEVLAIYPSYFEAYLLKIDIYRELDSIAPQIKSIEKALKINSEKHPKLYYLLGTALYRSGEYNKAISSFNEYLFRVNDSDPFVKRAQQTKVKCENALILFKMPVKFEAINLGLNINSVDDEYWPSLTVDSKTLIFTRLVGSRASVVSKNFHAQEDFYTSNFENNEWQKSLPLSAINTLNNEGAQSISTDGKLLFFTACSRKDSKGSCDIYFSRNKGGEWSVPENCNEPVNSPFWESQPSISANGETLYFVSSRPGGKGGMDIWKCNLKGFGNFGNPIWGEPINMGDSINTSGNEISPFIHPDGKTLYFATDFWPGMGGFDMFYSRSLNDDKWSAPVNLGYPINTFKDEQGLIVDANGKNAYYSSDRPGSRGMDIYSFQLHKNAQPRPVSYVKGKVYDAETGKEICATIEIVDFENSKNPIKGETCWDKGEFLLCLPVGKEYLFNVSKEGYLFYSDNIKISVESERIDPKILDIKLKKIEVGGSVILRNIFFNTASYEILENSKIELEKLVSFLNLNSTIIIEIRGHTDIIGTSEYNKVLSENRAKAVYEFLANRDINKERMTFAGFGFNKPISTNETDEGRALNRRTEFRIIKK